MACANLANLQLARASARRKEFGIRLALGASRGRLVWQVLTESAVLALGGGVLGLLFANWASRLIVRQISTSRAPVLLDLSVDWSLLGFTFAVAAFTVCIVGLAPAFRAIASGANVLLRSNSRSLAAGWRSMNLEKSIVVIQMALSLVLVFGAALFVRSFATLATLDAGFDRQEVLVASLDTPTGYSAERRRAEFQEVLEALRAHPDIRSAAQTTQIPLTSNSWTSGARAPGVEKTVFMNRVTSGYFTTLGTPIYAGRDFTAADTPEAPLVAIVNERFARTFFGEANPIGRTFESDDLKNRRIEVVGVAKDSKYLDLRRAAPETVFLAASQSSGSPRNFVVRSVGDPARAIGTVASTVRTLNPSLRLEFRVFDTIAGDSLAQERLLAMLTGFFGVLALLVAGLGLYGVMSLAVSGRRREIALRIALGAPHFSVLWMVMRDVAIVTATGMSAGVLLGWLGGRLAAALLVDAQVSGIAAWGIATGLLATAAGLAGYLPARRAARVDPMLVLREE
jgi:predicted permease